MREETAVCSATQTIDVAEQFAIERSAVAEVVATSAPRLWLWRPSNAIVLTARERDLVQSTTARSFATQGWPVVVRDSGGGPVALGHLCLNVSWLTPVHGAVSIERSYSAFCEPLIAAMAQLGLAAHCAALPGSYCDGRFNLLVDGRKLAVLVYRYNNHRIALTVWPSSSTGNATPSLSQQDGFALASWRHGGFEMRAIADTAPSRMVSFAAALDRAIDADR